MERNEEMSNKEKLFLYIANLAEEDAKRVLPLFKAFLNKEKPEEKLFCEVIYCIKHNRTGKEYIGRSNCYTRRIKEHKAALKKGKHPVEDMQSDYDKFGDDYTITVLDLITDFWDISREFELMYDHESYIRGKGYNYKDRSFPRWKNLRSKDYATKRRKNPLFAC